MLLQMDYTVDGPGRGANCTGTGENASSRCPRVGFFWDNVIAAPEEEREKKRRIKTPGVRQE